MKGEGPQRQQPNTSSITSLLGGNMPFELPHIEENAEGWGPTTVPAHLDGVPFMPYSKGERLGRIADFGQQAGRGMYQGEEQDGLQP